jgi:phytanoyl-CoA hydroxylase
MLSNEQLLNFRKWGFLVLPEFAPAGFCQSLLDLVEIQIKRKKFPVEYEADTGYPGAPHSRTDEGGLTSRRLLAATERDPRFLSWATHQELHKILQQLLGDTVCLSQSHHNCIMTKYPKHSSSTGWHRDSRYWNFVQPELISAWLALTDERPENGCLWVLPNSHRWEVESFQLDEKQFLRTDFSKNREFLERATAIELNQGDLLLFHSNLFHAAGKNTTESKKCSLVFTYRAESNRPKPGSSSTKKPDILL